MANLLQEQEAKPGQVHALVVGTSVYPHADPALHKYGVEPLTSAARSAAEFAAWLLTDYSRRDELASLRILLSPAENETIPKAVADRLQAHDDYSSTLINFVQTLRPFMAACEFPESTAMIYFAGHGVQVSAQGATVLLHDYLSPEANLLDDGRNPLGRAIDVADLHASMNGAKFAQNQYWFVDTCRQKAGQTRHFDELEGGYRVGVKSLGDTKVSPIFYAAARGATAYAVQNEVSLFSEALIWALEGNVAVRPVEGVSDKWYISPGALIDGVTPRLSKIAAAHGAEQTLDPAGRVGAGVMHQYDPVPAPILQALGLAIASPPPAAAAPDSQPKVELCVDFDVGSYLLNDRLSWQLRTGAVVVAEGEGSGTATAGPGTYDLVAALPDGEHVRSVTLVDATITETFDWEQMSPQLDSASGHSDSGTDAPLTVVSVRGATGHVLDSQLVFQPEGNPERVPTADIQSVDGRRYTASLPINPQSGYPEDACLVLLGEHGLPTVRFAPERKVGATLLGYLETHQFTSARTMSITSSDALMGKYRDPAAAALGGLTMDRFGELDVRSAWVDNLARDFAWLPDGTILRVKLHLATDAPELDALLDELLTATAHRPMYTDALMTAIQLFKSWPEPGGRVGEIADRLAQLRRLSAQRVIGSTVLITEPAVTDDD